MLLPGQGPSWSTPPDERKKDGKRTGFQRESRDGQKGFSGSRADQHQDRQGGISHLTHYPPTATITRMVRTSAVADAGRVRPDSKGRITLGKLAEGVSSYRVKVQAHGKIILEPFAEIPAHERWLFENSEALRRVRKGLAEAEAGRMSSLGSFSPRSKK